MAKDKDKDPEKLHIFINRRRFDEADGVKPVMNGGEIAGLVNVTGDNAKVERESGPDKGEISSTQEIPIKMGQHFLVTRRIVEGGTR